MGCPPSAARAHHGEVCAVDDFQLVAVRVAHRADADHTSQLGGEGGGGKGGRQGHGSKICTPSMPTNAKLESLKPLFVIHQRHTLGGGWGQKGLSTQRKSNVTSWLEHEYNQI